MRLVLLAVLGAFAGLAAAQADPVQVLPPAQIDATGHLKWSGGPTLGKRSGNLFTMLPAVQPRIGCMPIELFGGVADGTTDNRAALTAAVAANNGRIPAGGTDTGVCVQFSAGTYYFAGPWTYEYPTSGAYPNRNGHALTLRGAGSTSTQLKFAPGDGIRANLHGYRQTVHMSGLKFVSTGSIGSGGPNTAGSGIKITQTECLLSFGTSTFDDLSFDGADPRSVAAGGLQQSWSTGAEIIGLSGTSWKGIDVYGDETWVHGNGISLKGNMTAGSPGCPSAFRHSIYHNFDHITLKQLDIGLLLDDYIQGVTISGANFQNGNYGIYQPPGMTAPDNVQLNVTNSQFQVGVANIAIKSGFSLFMVTNTVFLMGPNPGVVGIDLTGTNLATIVGNVFNSIAEGGAGGYGVTTNGSASAISGNTFSGLTTGIELRAGSGSNTVGDNNFNVVTTPYVNAGSSNTMPTVRSAAVVSVTTCSPTGFFIPHGQPSAPSRERVQVTVALPATGNANMSNPTVMVTDVSATTVTVTFACGTLGVAGNILLNVSSSL